MVHRGCIFVMNKLVSILISQHLTYQHLTNEQRRTAVKRLTALWAFCESGLGGVLHALQMPFTGLVIGGLAVIIITLIAVFAEQQYRLIFKSLLLVLMIKVIISPYTPFTAYIAVGFQAVMGYVIFHLFNINFLSILLLSTIAMLESAMQKLLILTLLFGSSFWKATNELVFFITSQINLPTLNGSQWVIGIYLLIYFLGGIAVAWMAYTVMISYTLENKYPVFSDTEYSNPGETAENKIKLKAWIMLFILISITVLLFVFAPNAKQGWMAVIKTLCWTFTVLVAWYLLISPALTKLIRLVLNKKISAYSEEIADTLATFPALKKIAVAAWRKSSAIKGWRRWSFFIAALIHWSLIYNNGASIKKLT